MKLSKITAATAVLAAGLSLAACGNGEEETDTGSSTTAASSSATAAAPELPSAADLNEVIAVASDPNLPTEQKVYTVQGGETAPELFETMALSKQESGADFQVVDPVLPGFTPDSVLATVNFSLPERDPQVAENVEFIYEEDTWKLSQSWACSLITNTVDPAQVPEMCLAQTPAEGAPAEEAPAELAPAEEMPAEEMPVQ
ncbi:hypothetical protein COCCU_09330 [Corynebacterium occultum]|uniref:Low molecular weight antigen MTB12-like C-terminal domain-containing protein n=1 Tax=Corynebacterium occultum TaxID=2675219 RepID=A0A6B8WCS2_9CORY|nr:hypothetical protein [Corynebacterium occultum]QGU07790.1 hypothetical protein COCCU_09330 [Corynebacterium occultum]